MYERRHDPLKLDLGLLIQAARNNSEVARTLRSAQHTLPLLFPMRISWWATRSRGGVAWMLWSAWSTPPLLLAAVISWWVTKSSVEMAPMQCSSWPPPQPLLSADGWPPVAGTSLLQIAWLVLPPRLAAPVSWWSDRSSGWAAQAFWSAWTAGCRSELGRWGHVVGSASRPWRHKAQTMLPRPLHWLNATSVSQPNLLTRFFWRENGRRSLCIPFLGTRVRYKYIMLIIVGIPCNRDSYHV